MTDDDTLISQLKQRVLTFCEVRHWRNSANPRDIAISISLESSELLEHFQWDTDFSPDALKKDLNELNRLTNEVADIFIYAILFADRLNIDLTKAINSKLMLNEKKYPQKLFKAKKMDLKQYKKIKLLFRTKSTF